MEQKKLVSVTGQFYDSGLNNMTVCLCLQSKKNVVFLPHPVSMLIYPDRHTFHDDYCVNREDFRYISDRRCRHFFP
jgi:hypothetical protein